jgi:hypothetical protein
VVAVIELAGSVAWLIGTSHRFVSAVASIAGDGHIGERGLRELEVHGVG